ncbi:MAG: alpha/beta hydrolase [Conchiformibius sp.]|nr:alpha/beta hydrolase [Conchiformibius sp.]
MARMSPERLAKALEQEKTISPADYEKVKGLANIVRPLRSFIFKTPDEYGMNYQELVIPSADGVPLEAWYIPAKQPSNKLIIFNHALPMCRSGFPGHFGLPWAGFDAVEIDFIIQYKHLTDAGYNVLTYDVRNHGNSGAANNGLSGIGNWEWRDCVGVKQFVDAHPEWSKMTVGLYSQCMGGNSQYRAIMERPELFENVKCMVSPMVVSMSAIYDAFSELQGVHQYQELIDLELLRMGAFTAAEMTPHLWAHAVKMPTLIVQVKDDAWTRNPEDGQKTFDLLGAEEKEIFWIEGTTRRFKDGYNWFGREPQTVLAFLDKYMK